MARFQRECPNPTNHKKIAFDVTCLVRLMDWGVQSVQMLCDGYI